MGIPNQITLSGKAYIKYIEDTSRCSSGDVLLYLNDDSINPFPGNYEDLTSSGYIKAKIFDGSCWHHIDIGEFCLHRENKFTKKQRSLDYAYLCKDIMIGYKGEMVEKKYRGHFARCDG